MKHALGLTMPVGPRSESRHLDTSGTRYSRMTTRRSTADNSSLASSCILRRTVILSRKKKKRKKKENYDFEISSNDLLRNSGEGKTPDLLEPAGKERF